MVGIITWMTDTSHKYGQGIRLSIAEGIEIWPVCGDISSAGGDAGADFLKDDLFNLLREALGDFQVPQDMA